MNVDKLIEKLQKRIEHHENIAKAETNPFSKTWSMGIQVALTEVVTAIVETKNGT